MSRAFTVEPGTGKRLIGKLGLPSLVRVRELSIRPATNGDIKGEPILNLTCEFSDGEYRGQHWQLLDLAYSMLQSGTAALVTDQYQKYLYGAINEHHQSPTVQREVALQAVGEVLFPFADVVKERVSELEEQLRVANERIRQLEQAKP
jgi:hypothetical protein